MNDLEILPNKLRNLAGYKTTHGATCSEAGMLNTAAYEIESLLEARNKEFKERVYELAFGDDAINKDYSDEEVIAVLREFSDKALELDAIEHGD